MKYRSWEKARPSAKHVATDLHNHIQLQDEINRRVVSLEQQVSNLEQVFTENKSNIKAVKHKVQRLQELSTSTAKSLGDKVRSIRLPRLRFE